jgi:hypothetical protein
MDTRPKLAFSVFHSDLLLVQAAISFKIALFPIADQNERSPVVGMRKRGFRIQLE